MNKRRVALTVCKVLLCILLVTALIGSIFCASVSRIFSVSAVEKQLKKDGFYTFATRELEDAVADLQGVIGMDTTAVLAAIQEEQIEQILAEYTRVISTNLLTGEEQTYEIAFTSDALYQLVCSSITQEQYDGDTAQMTADRQAAYADLTAAVNETLAFFPQTLYGYVTDILEESGLRLSTLYAAVETVRSMTLPLIILTVLLAAGIFFCSRQDKPRGLRTVAGCTFVTSSVFFLLCAFIRSYPLPDRLSLSDGLLRRYILAVMNNMGGSISLVVTVAFIIGVLLLIASIAWEVYAKNSCTEE